MSQREDTCQYLLMLQDVERDSEPWLCVLALRVCQSKKNALADIAATEADSDLGISCQSPSPT